MTKPTFLQITPEIRGAVTRSGGGLFLVSALHEPTGQAVYGIEETAEGAISWLQSAKAVFAEPEGSA